MNTDAMDYYQTVVCMKPVQNSKQICCREKDHSGNCEHMPKLHLIDSSFSQKEVLEETLGTFVTFIENQLHPCPMKYQALAATAFDFIAYASSLIDNKAYVKWDNDTDILRSTIYGHIFHINLELKKLRLQLFDQYKTILCPIIGKAMTTNTFMRTLSSPTEFVKSNIILSSEDMPDTSYVGPYIIPVSQTGVKIINNLHIVDHDYSNKWQNETTNNNRFKNSNY